jgi:hypothetical protein
MKNRAIIFLISVWIFSFLPTLVHSENLEEVNKQISAAILEGKAQDLSKYFNDMVDCGIAGNEDTYSKAQTTRIIQSFFEKYPVKSIKITKQGFSTDGSQYSIGELLAGGKTFRLFYLLKNISGNYLIQQIQIQEEH